MIHILIFTFLIRVVGINYGLPLWLIDDEPPFTLAALKMLQLKTLLPAAHLEEFKTILYYPPYLSYLYFVPFSILLGIKYLFFSGSREQFVYYLTSDLSPFFLIARFLNVLMGVLSVYSVYQIGKKLFKQEVVGLATAFFLATSLFHILMSSNGRHWLPVSFFTVLVLWILSLDWEFRKKYFTAILIAGFGIGVSFINALLLILIAGWYLFYEKRSLTPLLKEKYFYVSLSVFAVLAVLPAILYPQSFGFRGDVTFQETKSVLGIIASPFLFLKPIALSDPILVGFAVLGLLFLFLCKRNLFWPFFTFIYAYSAIFYLFFRYEHRFTLTIFSILALLAGIGFFSLHEKIRGDIPKKAFLLILIPILVFSLRLGYLMRKNDSRTLLREWTEQNLPADSRILVFARLARLPSTQAAIREQELLDPASLRRVDDSERNFSFPEKKYFHALNLHNVINKEFYDTIEKYAKKNGYQYIFLGSTDPREFDRLNKLQKLADKGKLLKSFGEFQEIYSPSIGQLLGSPLGLFKLKEFGPPVAIYKLQ